MNVRLLFVVLLAAVVSLTCAPSEAAQLSNASATERSASSLADAVRQAERAKNPVTWIAYDVPVNEPNAVMCCFDSIERGAKQQWKGGSCSLAGDKSPSTFTSRGDDRSSGPAARRETFSIFLRVREGRVDRVRTFSSDCSVDAGGVSVQRLGVVNGEESVDFLAALLDAPAPRGKGDDERSGAIVAIALHRATNAMPALAAVVQSHRDEEVRGQAAFWIGMKGGNDGRKMLRGVIDGDGSDEVREQAIAGIAQDDARAATDLLLTLAKTHADPSVRKRAIFWLGLKAGERAAADLKDAADDPDDEVREAAVFAISQLPADRAIPELIALARTNRSGGVRERAVFWLGQSGDSRALDFIEELLAR